MSIILNTPMEIVKAFKNDLNVVIKGTVEKPLFRANDIGAILEIANTRSMTKDFDQTEKVVVSIDTPGEAQETTFLTEKGLYQVLFT